MTNKYPLVLTGTTVEELQSTDVIPVDAGGTGQTTLAANSVLLGNGTNGLQTVAPGILGNVLASDGATWVSAPPTGGLSGVTNSASPFMTALGYQAGNANTSIYNTFIGYQAGAANTTGYGNTIVGYTAYASNTTGEKNTAVGDRALNANTVGNNNTALGRGALSANISGSGNTALGSAVLSSNTTGESNTAAGFGVLSNNTIGSYNTALGQGSLNSNTTGESNTVVGFRALRSNISGGQNTAIGDQAGYGVLGTEANITGSNNTFLGYQAVGASTSASNVITLGNSSITTLRCQVTTITALSDARDKTDIAELDAGLDFINALAPVSFTWNMRDGGKVDEPDTGFIAQELIKAQEDTGHHIPGLVYDENPERLEAGYGKLIPVLVKAIQELSAEVVALKSQLGKGDNK